jgi:hypothetical protein
MERVKRQITLMLLMFANVFLLAHAVLPHSHHDGIVCFSFEKISHCNHCSDHHDISGCCCEYNKKNHHSNSEDCNLKDIILRQHDDLHEEILPCENCLSLSYTLYLLSDLYFDTIQYGLRLEQKPYLDNYISPFVGSVKSLRAPPVSYFLG